jgi:thiamine biosynthesis protein ThiS
MTGGVRLRSVSLHVRDEGEGAPVLFVHGFPSTGELWDGVAPRVRAAGFRAIVPDLAGYGRSQAPERIDMAAQADYLVELLDALDLPGAGRGVAVAVDAEVVPRGEWEATELHDGARVEVLHAIQGG